MSKEVSKWASERLHDILGFSDRNLADYLVSLAYKASSAAELSEKLYENEVPRGESTERFCHELFGKCRQRTGAPAAKSAPSSQSNAALLRKSAKYEMVNSSDDDDDGAEERKTSKIKK